VQPGRLGLRGVNLKREEKGAQLTQFSQLKRLRGVYIGNVGYKNAGDELVYDACI